MASERGSEQGDYSSAQSGQKAASGGEGSASQSGHGLTHIPTKAEVLELLKTKGITDLDGLVEAGLAEVREKAGETDDWTLDISAAYIHISSTTPPVVVGPSCW